jgi:IS5 family transposase
MQLYNDLMLKFERPNWSSNPELGLIDTILEGNPRLIQLLSRDIVKGVKYSDFGRKDTPTVEQIVRAAIYKEFKSLTYRDLEYAQTDSRICATFIGVDELRPYSYQVWQKYISKIGKEALQEFLVELNKIAIEAGLEDLASIRTDSTVVESNIHHPTNNSLVWDCIKEAHRLLNRLAEKEDIKVRDYRKAAKSNHFKINNSLADKRTSLFVRQLNIFTRSIKQVDKFVKKKDYQTIESLVWVNCLRELHPLMQQVYSMTKRKEVKGEVVANSEKIFSIYERHTDIIVKGKREVEFGHKINLTDGRSKLILDCQVLKGNPSDSHLFNPAIDRIGEFYEKFPKNIAADGGYASKANQQKAADQGLINIVFNKIVGSMKNLVSSKNMQTRLRKWRSGIEATISNLKRGFDISRCNWKGWEHFCSKVFWSVIGYNIRVMTGLLVAQIR